MCINKKIKKFCREANIKELKKSLGIIINRKEINTKEKLIYLLKNFVYILELRKEIKKCQ